MCTRRSVFEPTTTTTPGYRPNESLELIARALIYFYSFFFCIHNFQPLSQRSRTRCFSIIIICWYLLIARGAAHQHIEPITHCLLTFTMKWAQQHTPTGWLMTAFQNHTYLSGALLPKHTKSLCSAFPPMIASCCR